VRESKTKQRELEKNLLMANWKKNIFVKKEKGRKH
jgi:hypothetical protein